MQLTHLDLDGAGCAIVLNWMFGSVSERRYGAYDDLDKNIEEMLLKATEDDPLWLTDLCPRQDSPLWPKIIAAANEGRFFLVDHHETSVHTSSIPGSENWAWISSGVCSATKRLWLLCNERQAPPTTCRHDVELDFVQAVDAYDMWLLDSVHRARGEVLNRLVNFVGLERFVADFTMFPGADETEWHKTSVVLKEREVKFVAEAVEKYGKSEMLFRDAARRPFLIVPLLGSKPCPQVGKAVLDAVPEAKYSVVVWGDQSSCSLYSRDNDDEMDVSVIAKALGGGGHKHAAGGKTGMGSEEGSWSARPGIPEIVRRAVRDRIFEARS